MNLSLLSKGVNPGLRIFTAFKHHGLGQNLRRKQFHLYPDPSNIHEIPVTIDDAIGIHYYHRHTVKNIGHRAKRQNSATTRQIVVKFHSQQPSYHNKNEVEGHHHKKGRMRNKKRKSLKGEGGKLQRLYSNTWRSR